MSVGSHYLSSIRTLVGSTVANSPTANERVVRVDGNGRLEVVAPAGAPLDVNLAEVAGTATVEAGTSGVQAIGGPEADGAAAASNPVQIAGVDGSGNIQALAVSTSGNPQVEGNVAHDAVDSGNPVLQGYRARQTLDTAVAEDDRVRGTADLYGRQYTHSAAHDTLSVSDKVTVENGPETQNDGGVLAVEVNLNGTKYYYIDMTNYSKLGLQIEITGGSPPITIEGTLEDNGTAAASCDYQDISSAAFGAASWTADAMLIDDAGFCGLFKYIRVKAVGTGSEDFEIFYKRMY